MSLLFLVNKDQTAVLHPEVIKLCPLLGTLSEKEQLYVILFADYNSPYKQYPEHERRRKAMWQAFQENETDLVLSATIAAAVNDYISLQYNPKIETARVYQQKVDELQQALTIESSWTNMKKIGDAIDDLNKRIGILQKDYELEMQKTGVIKGNMTQSFLEKLQANKKLYDSLVNKSK